MLTLSVRRTKRLNAGHLWVFSNELAHVPTDAEPGTQARLLSPDGKFMGTGYFNPHSLISFRVLSYEDKPIDREFIASRIRAALDYRKRIIPGRESYRLIHGEADMIPGLIADKYGDCLVMQFLTYGIEKLGDEIASAMEEILNPKTIVLRNDGHVRTLEGLPLEKTILKGSLDELPIVKENHISLRANPMEGQKTGFFLDQLENRLAFRRYVKGPKGLDLFSYVGAWGMHMAALGVETTLVDESAKALELAARNASENGLNQNIKTVKADVFEFLKSELAIGEERYSTIVIDPPAFVKSAKKINEAVHAYISLNEKAMRLLAPGGVLATSSCSYHIEREAFMDIIMRSARNAGKRLRLLEYRSQGPDHPVLLSVPETEYLKCAFLETY